MKITTALQRCLISMHESSSNHLQILLPGTARNTINLHLNTLFVAEFWVSSEMPASWGPREIRPSPDRVSGIGANCQSSKWALPQAGDAPLLVRHSLRKHAQSPNAQKDVVSIPCPKGGIVGIGENQNGLTVSTLSCHGYVAWVSWCPGVLGQRTSRKS